MLDDETVAALLAERTLAEVVGFATEEVARSASGTSVLAYSGKTYIDFTSGIAVNSLGHNHSVVSEAIIEQCRHVTHTSDIMRHTPQLELASWMRGIFHDVAPGPPWSILFKNSGSESIDAAAKLALKITGRSNIVAFDGAFHGRSLFGTALSHSKSDHWKPYEQFLAPLRDNVRHVPSPTHPSCVAEFSALIDSIGSEIAAVFFEGMQGEGGYRPMPPDVANIIRRKTAERGILLIADEVQSGWGRTGKWFAFQHVNITPDIVAFGKAVGGGLPLAGVAASHLLMEQWLAGEHGTTFGGNPLACSAGMAALKFIEANGLVEEASSMGEFIKSRLHPMIGTHGVADVRGYGLMIGIEFQQPDGNPDYAKCDSITQIACDKGLLILTCGANIGKPGTDNSSIRLIPPLNAKQDAIEQGLEILTESIKSAG
jgi:4-aminobutyrate aminotransferase